MASIDPNQRASQQSQPDQPQRNNLTNKLNDDVLLQVLGNLDYQDLSRVASVNKNFKKLDITAKLEFLIKNIQDKEIVGKLNALKRSFKNIANINEFIQLRDEVRHILQGLPLKTLEALQKLTHDQNLFLDLAIKHKKGIDHEAQDFLTAQYVQEENVKGVVESLEGRYHLENQGLNRSIEKIIKNLIDANKVDLAIGVMRGVYDASWKTPFMIYEKDLLGLIASYLILKGQKEKALELLTVIPENRRADFIKSKIETLQHYCNERRQFNNQTEQRWLDSIKGFELLLQALEGEKKDK